MATGGAMNSSEIAARHMGEAFNLGRLADDNEPYLGLLMKVEANNHLLWAILAKMGSTIADDAERFDG